MATSPPVRQTIAEIDASAVFIHGVIDLMFAYMTTEPQHHLAGCRRVGDILERVGDKWAVLLLMAIGERRMRFGELHRAINGISQRMLTVTLRNLEHDGILIRTVYPTIPPRVEYELSDRGRSLKLALAPISKWVMENQTDIEETRERVREQIPVT